MNKIIIIISFLLFPLMNYQVLAVSTCKGNPDNYRHNCIGTYSYSDESKYLGEWKNNKRSGSGVYYWTKGKYKGDLYVGEFKNDTRHGYGIYTFNSGAKDIGEFRNGRLNGFAIRYDQYGNILKEGIWKNDKFLYKKKKSIISSYNSKLEGYKNFCEEIGFTPGTEKFGECVMKAMEKG